MQKVGRRDRIAVIEPRCWGLEHVPFNAALIATALEAFPAAQLDLYGEATHLEAVKELLSHTRPGPVERVNWHRIEIPARTVNGWTRFADVRALFTTLDRELQSRPPSGIAIATTDPQVLSFLKVRLLTSWGGIRAIAVCHELLAVLGRRRVRSARWWGLNAALAAPHPRNLTYMVLADSIRANLETLAPRMARRVIAVDHPSLMGDMPAFNSPTEVPQLRFGFVGGGRNAKGLQAFVDLAVAVRRDHPQVVFEVVGSAPADIPHSALAQLTWSNQKLPLTEFISRLRGLSHAVWLGDPVHYRLVASGSLVDTIALGIPVICLKGPFVDHLFGRMENIGVRCDTLRDVQREVLNLVTHFSTESYRRQRETLLEVRASLAPETWALQLQHVLSPSVSPYLANELP